MHFLSALAQHEMEWYSQYMKPELILNFGFSNPVNVVCTEGLYHNI